jgi:ribosome-binding protein aMBF1 (putative translation factor)
MFYVFRGKDEKTDKAGKCEFCGRSICSSEVSHAIKGHTVCGQCYKKIEERKGRIT